MAAFQVIQLNPKKFQAGQIKFLIILLPICAVMILPIIYIICQAFKPLDELFYFPPRIVVINPTLSNFEELFRLARITGLPWMRYLLNSLVITILFVVCVLFLSVTTGYAFSKKEFKIKNAFFQVNQLALMFVAIAVQIPTYLIISYLGLIDSFWVHIIPSLAVPVYLFLMKQNIDDVPKEILESAKLDGANDLQIILKFVIPLVKPTIATIAILAFQSIWNSGGASTIYLNSESLKTLPYYLGLLSSQAGINAAGVSAASSLILFIPNLVIFIVMQSKVMNTMARSGIK